MRNFCLREKWAWTKPQKGVISGCNGHNEGRSVAESRGARCGTARGAPRDAGPTRQNPSSSAITSASTVELRAQSVRRRARARPWPAQRRPPARRACAEQRWRPPCLPKEVGSQIVPPVAGPKVAVPLASSYSPDPPGQTRGEVSAGEFLVLLKAVQGCGKDLAIAAKVNGKMMLGSEASGPSGGRSLHGGAHGADWAETPPMGSHDLWSETYPRRRATQRTPLTRRWPPAGSICRCDAAALRLRCGCVAAVLRLRCRCAKDAAVPLRCCCCAAAAMLLPLPLPLRCRDLRLRCFCASPALPHAARLQAQ